MYADSLSGGVSGAVVELLWRQLQMLLRGICADLVTGAAPQPSQDEEEEAGKQEQEEQQQEQTGESFNMHFGFTYYGIS